MSLFTSSCGIANRSGMSSLSGGPTLTPAGPTKTRRLIRSGILARHLGRDPAADRAADDFGFGQVKPVQQFEIQISDVVDAIEPVGQARFAEAGMGRSDQAPFARQLRGKTLPGIVALAAMQEQQRAAMACLEHFEVDSRDPHLVRIKRGVSLAHRLPARQSLSTFALRAWCRSQLGVMEVHHCQAPLRFISRGRRGAPAF